MIYYIADMHFGHKNVLRFDNRPFADTDLMDEVLIHNWNERVTGEDIVYVLGDAFWKNEENSVKIIQRLNGHKHLIRGNHDRVHGRLRFHWESIEQYAEINDGNIKHIRKSVRKEIFDYLHSLPLNIDIEVNGQPYILVHGGAIAAYHNYMYRYDTQEEYAVWNRIYYNEPDIEGKIIIFGHTPTSEYQHNNPLEIWQSPSGGKIGIDCGCGFPHPLSQGRHPAYGRLACLRLDDMQVFYSEEEIPEEVEEILW